MTARDDILGAIRRQQVRNTPRPASYQPPLLPDDHVETFAARARAVDTDVRILSSVTDVPAVVADLLRGKNLPAEIHIAPDAMTVDFASISVKRTPPGPDDTAMTTASFGIAETGTLTYPAQTGNPASWHFRAGFEIAILRASDILPYMENVIAQIKMRGALPHTINFVTGPSRTGDIEQTLELGAHGPKALAILIIPE